MSSALTEGVRVDVESRYVPEQSSPERGRYFFAYTVRISNDGSMPVQLLSRHWIISDARGRIEHVRGPGVVGQQPTLKPGEEFRYTSACPLNTPVGTMHGSFQMVPDGGEAFDAKIEPFRLARPGVLN